MLADQILERCGENWAELMERITLEATAGSWRSYRNSSGEVMVQSWDFPIDRG